MSKQAIAFHESCVGDISVHSINVMSSTTPPASSLLLAAPHLVVRWHRLTRGSQEVGHTKHRGRRHLRLQAAREGNEKV